MERDCWAERVSMMARDGCLGELLVYLLGTRERTVLEGCGS